MNQKNEFVDNMLEDFAVLHNMSIHDAMRLKQIHEILLGIQNALNSGAYDDLEFEEFKKMIFSDIEKIISR